MKRRVWLGVCAALAGLASLGTCVGCGGGESAIQTMDAAEVAAVFSTRDAGRLLELVGDGVGRREQFQGQALSVWCVRANWPEGLEILDRAGYDPNAANTAEAAALLPGFAALHVAILTDATPNGRLDREAFVGRLLALGANPNQPCRYDNAGVTLERATPLHCALLFPDTLRLDAHEATLRVCRRLLRAGAKPDAVSPRIVKGREDAVTPLSLAVRYGNADLCRLLVEAGANPRRDLGGGVTPLSLAQERGDTALLRILRGEKGR